MRSALFTHLPAARRHTTPLLLALLLAACGTDAPTGKALPTWTLREEWRVGGEAEGPHSFDANFGLEILPGDTLVHFDYQDQRFHLLDRNGAPGRSFGHKGAGPGEIAGANGFVVARNGDIIVNDLGNKRLMRFTPAGSPLGSVPIPATFTLGVRWNATALDDGRLIERYATVVDSLGLRVWFDRTRLWSADLASSEELPRDSCLVAPRPAGGQATVATTARADAVSGLLPIPYSGPWFATVVDRAGFIWGQSVRGGSELKKVPIGQCVATATLTLSADTPPIPVAVRDSAHEAMTKFASAVGGALPADFAVPERYPPFNTLHVDEQHRLWVQRFGPAGEAVMEIFDSAGVPVARVNNFPLNTRWPLLFDRGRVYGFVADDNGVKFLVALIIVE